MERILNDTMTVKQVTIGEFQKSDIKSPKIDLPNRCP